VLVTWQWLSARAGSLPLVLAGPILRRVEPGMVCVWVATRQAQNIALTVQAAGAAASTLAATNVTSALPNGEPTVQLGDNLFVALLTAKPPASAPLQPGVLYLYDLTFTSSDKTSTSFASAMSAPGATPDLSSILYTDQVSGDARPSFSLPPKTLSQVRLAHASCRKAGGEGMDALPLLDKVIADARTGASDAQFALNRPHQLFLTGDQIYADDVTDSYLGMCIDAAGWLMGTRQEPAPALLGVLGPPDSSGNHPFPDQANGWKPLDYRQLGGSTPWDQAKWPGVGVRGKLVFAAGLTAVPPDSDKLDPVKQVLPTGGREVRKYHLTRNHLLALGEFYAALLLAWSPVLWCPPGATGDPLPLPYDGSTALSHVDDDAATVARFGAGVAAVRRVLANVPTYMICDDHDVSDDWFMNRLWCRRVLDLPGDTLGRRIVRNALIAYAVFQAWGNTPGQFDTTASSTLGGQLLTLLAAGKEMTDDVTTSSASGVSALVGMPTALADTSPALVRPSMSLTWHYRWGPPGWPYEVIVLDCRTVRRYGDGLIQPPQLLDDGTAPSGNPDQFAAQLGTPATSGVTLVVAQTPVLGVRWIEDTFQRSDRTKSVFDKDAEAWSLSAAGYELMLTRLAAHNPNGVILLSGDVHYSFAASADYHGTAPWGEKGTLPAPRTARIVQLNSSSARNETGLTRDFLHVTGYSVLPMAAAETWAGFRARPAYTTAALRAYAAGGHDPIALALKVNLPPIVLTKEDYKALFGGSAAAPTPDWKYRIQFASGTRANPPSFTAPPQLSTLPPSLTNELTAAGLSLASLVQHIRAVAGTEIVGKNNVCVVTFTGLDKGSWHVRQAVMWRPDQPADVFSSPDPLKTTPVSLTTPSDVTTFDIPLQYGPEPQMS
jgi:hypothetical protein